MRLRVLALPAQILGAASCTPFLLVFDRCTADACEYLRDAALKETAGAAAVLVFAEEVELDQIQLGDLDVDGLDLDALKRAFADA